jgi:hypothetical protein
MVIQKTDGLIKKLLRLPAPHDTCTDHYRAGFGGAGE